MSRYNLTQGKVGAGRGPSIKFGTPQAFRLAVSRTPTTVYLPVPLNDDPTAAQKSEAETLRSRLLCFPNPGQYMDNLQSSLPDGNYRVRYVPIVEDLSDDDEQSMDTDFNGNGVENPELQMMDLGLQCNSVMASPKATPFPQNFGSTPPPPPPPTPSGTYDLVHPPSARPLTYGMLIVVELVLSGLNPHKLIIESPLKPIKTVPNPQPVPAAQEEKIHKIYKRNLEVLKKEQWLDDTVVEFYLYLITARNSKNPEFYPSVYKFGCEFYPLLATTGGLVKVEKAAEGANIFAFDLVYFPVCMSDHWILVVLDNRSKKITAYNSLKSSPVKLICNNIIRYLVHEYRRRNNGNDPTEKWERITNEDNDKIPQQENPFDCGVFLLQFAEYLSRDEAFDFSQIHMDYFRMKCCYEIISGKLITE